MITCDLFGGLGNNLFQLAFVYAVHKKYNYDLKVPVFTNRGDIAQYNQEPNLEFKNLFENEFEYTDQNLFLPQYIHPDKSLTIYHYIDVPIADNICYHGYFQSDRYFLEIDISTEFKLQKRNIEYIKNKYETFFNKKNISLHYRLGGDRVTDHMQHFHKNVSVSYYKEALNLIKEHNKDEFNILVFSDKPNLCKKLLSELNYPFIFIENENNIIDFTMMTLCDINIVGNSTFSWWAAYMNQNKNKKVFVTEKEWFGPGYSHLNLTDIFPKSWIRL